MVPSNGVGGGNPSGTNDPIRAINGGPHTPLMPPPFPTGQNWPAVHNPIMRWDDPINIGGGGGTDPTTSNTDSRGGGGGGGGSFPANGPAPTTGTSAGGGNLANILGFNPSDQGAFISAMQQAGFGSGVAQLLWNFLSSGAGANAQEFQAMVAALQPQVNRGIANIQEQFGAEGLGSSSPAAIGQADFLSQVNLNEGQIWAQMQQQATQDYLQVLMGGKSTPLPSGLGALIGGAGSLAGGLAQLYKVLFPGSSSSSSSGGGGGGGGVSIPVPGGGGGDSGVPWELPI